MPRNYWGLVSPSIWILSIARSFSTLLKLCKSLLCCVCLQCMSLAPVPPSTLLPEPHNIVTLLCFNHLAVSHHLWKTISPLRLPVKNSGNLNVNPSLVPNEGHCFLHCPLPSKSAAQNLFLWADHVLLFLPPLSLIFVFLLWKKSFPPPLSIGSSFCFDMLYCIWGNLVILILAFILSVYKMAAYSPSPKSPRPSTTVPVLLRVLLFLPEKTILANWSPLFYSQSSRVCFHWTFSIPFVPLCIKDERDSGIYPPSDLFHL